MTKRSWIVVAVVGAVIAMTVLGWLQYRYGEAMRRAEMRRDAARVELERIRGGADELPAALIGLGQLEPVGEQDARLLFDIGRAYSELGRRNDPSMESDTPPPAEVVDAHRAARDVFRRLHNGDPQHVESLQQLVRAERDLSDALRRQGSAEARGVAAEAVDHSEQLLQVVAFQIESRPRRARAELIEKQREVLDEVTETIAFLEGHGAEIPDSLRATLGATGE